MKKIFSIILLVFSVFINAQSPHFLASRSLNEKIDVVATILQSNGEGRDGDTSNPNYPFTSSNGYWFDGTTQHDISTDRGGAIEGSYANYLCEEYYSLTGRKLVEIEEATGGKGLTSTSTTGTNWSDGGGLWEAAKITIDAALNYYNKNSPLAIIMIGGERDAITMDDNGAYTKAIVKTAQQDLIDRIFTDYPDTIIIISELGTEGATNTQGWIDMRAIQNEVATENTNVFIGFNGAIDFDAEGKKIDDYHNDYTGNQEMGEAIANSLSTNTTDI